MNFFNKLFSNSKNIISELKNKYYKESLKKLHAGEELPININMNDYGFIKSMSIDKNKNIQVVVTLDIESTKFILDAYLEDKVKKDTTLLQISEDMEITKEDSFNTLVNVN